MRRIGWTAILLGWWFWVIMPGNPGRIAGEPDRLTYVGPFQNETDCMKVREEFTRRGVGHGVGWWCWYRD